MNKLITIFLILFSFHLSAQINIIEFPKDNQLYKRDVTTNEAFINVSGTINQSTGFTSLVLKIYRNSILQQNIPFTLNYVGGVSSFNFSPNIVSELASYKFELLSNNNDILETTNNVVAGDVYIIQGQSNAAGLKYVSSNADDFPDASPFIRTFSDNEWNTLQLRNYIGVLYFLSEKIIENHNIPVAIFNGSYPGGAIDYFLRNDSNTIDSTTNYGRLLKRYIDAGFNVSDVRAIIWYQGESNYNSSIDYYKTQFTDLYNDWQVDYNSSKIYMIQVRYGCFVNVTNIGNYKKTFEIPEAQRQLSTELANITLISNTTVEKALDDCHYRKEGYTEIGERMYKVFANDFYNSGVATGIYSSIIKNTRFTNSYKNQIKFDLIPANDTYTWQNGVENDFWIENSSITIVSGNIIDNTVTLNLSDNLIAIEDDLPKLSYLGNGFETMPFIVNQNNIGMVSFKNNKINHSVDTNFTNVVVGSWTYYYKNSDLINPIYAIEHNPTGIGANTLTFNVDAIEVVDNGSVISASDIEKAKGTFNLSKYWNLHLDSQTNGWVNIRFFYPSSIETDLISNANNFATTNSAQYVSNLLYIQTKNRTFNPVESIYTDGYTNSTLIEKCGLSSSYGTFMSNDYVQLNNVVLSEEYTGGSVIVKVENYENNILPGTIRYNETSKKFQGYNGSIWKDFN